MNKFKAKKIEIDGIVFDSLKEGNRYQELKLLTRCKKIHGLEIQPRYDIIMNGTRVAFYKADFKYFDVDDNCYKVEDVKGLKKGSAYQLFKLKKKLVEAYYGIEIIEI